MTNVQRAAELRGKTIRFAWMDGPTKGKTYEHIFHDDGTVEWRDADAPKTPASTETPKGDGAAKKPRVEYAAVKIADDVYLVSYKSNEGYTLTVALDFNDNSITGFASGAKSGTRFTARWRSLTENSSDDARRWRSRDGR